VKESSEFRSDRFLPNTVKRKMEAKLKMKSLGQGTLDLSGVTISRQMTEIEAAY